jgi:propanol-preferring alcohol dehydrogenase
MSSSADEPAQSRAMVLEQGQRKLRFIELPIPRLQPGNVLIQVNACAVCRTDLHIVDGELTNPKLPLVPGHEVVGIVKRLGPGSKRFELGQRVGVPWLGSTCGECNYCRSGRENLCEHAEFTGYTRDGGYAEYMTADERFCFPIPESIPTAEAAPLLCAGLIGFRSLAKTGDATRIGIYGFGAAAHIVTQIATAQGRQIYAFTRAGDVAAQAFARNMGAVWAGDSTGPAPEKLDAAIIFAPAGQLVPKALAAVAKGGTVVCGGIHMSDVPSFPYELLWGERCVCSVANLTRRDGDAFFALLNRIQVRTSVEEFPLSQANEALDRLRSGRIQGAAVLRQHDRGTDGLRLSK